jgi:iron complex transport system ATP-binding protein
MSVLQASGVAVGYQGKPVVSGVSFALEAGEVLALLGPNGGGKSTLLRTLAGLIPKLAGSIRIEGDEIESLSPRDIAKRIGFVPQEEIWQFAFSVSEVVSMGRLPISTGFFDTKEDREAADVAMRRAECFELKDRPVTELSGGERQRVLIARALAQNAPIIFLDEPTAHLDPQYQVGTAALLRDLAGSGRAILVAVHDLPIAGAMADRGMLIYGGGHSEAMDIKKLLESEELERAYGARFERLITEEGRLVVAPRTRDRLP